MKKLACCLLLSLFLVQTTQALSMLNFNDDLSNVSTENIDTLFDCDLEDNL